MAINLMLILFARLLDMWVQLGPEKLDGEYDENFDKLVDIYYEFNKTYGHL